MAFPDIADAIRGAEALDPPATFRYRANTRHRYERLRRLPAGLLALGDAVCSFNPVYGQGMTVAAMQAHALRAHLAERPAIDPLRYFGHIAKVISVPWDMTIGADLANPGVIGKRTPTVRMINAYIRQLHAASTDPALAVAFTRVSGLAAPPQSLLRPDRLVRVIAGNYRSANAATRPTNVRMSTTNEGE